MAHPRRNRPNPATNAWWARRCEARIASRGGARSRMALLLSPAYKIYVCVFSFNPERSNGRGGGERRTGERSGRMEEELKQRMEFQCAGGSVVVVSSEKIIMSRNQYGTYCTLMCNHNIVMPFSSVPRCFWRHFHNAGYLLTGHTLSAHLAPPLAPPQSPRSILLPCPAAPRSANNLPPPFHVGVYRQ